MSIKINDLTVRFKNGVVAVNKASLEIPKGCLLYTSSSIDLLSIEESLNIRYCVEAT